MSHDHHHDHHHDHDHGHTHSHDSHVTPEAGEFPRTVDGFWKKFKRDTRSIFEEGKNLNATPEAHGDHFHLNDAVSDVQKLGFAAGALVGLGVAIHGMVNIKRGVAGWNDKELDEKHEPSAQYTVIGAAETVGGLALMKRMLTGTIKLF